MKKNIPPLGNREEFAMFAQKYFVKTGNAAEIGVYLGQFASHNLQSWKQDYYMIDSFDEVREWDLNSGVPQDFNGHPHYDACKQVQHDHGDRVKIIKGLSVPVAETFEDGFFDWIYIDAMHDYKNVRDDLEAWWPKVRSGGIISGDDFYSSAPALEHYNKFSDKKTLTDDDVSFIQKIYTRKFEQACVRNYSNLASEFHWGVALAVNEFAIKHDKHISVTFAQDLYGIPAWMIVK